MSLENCKLKHQQQQKQQENKKSKIWGERKNGRQREGE